MKPNLVPCFIRKMLTGLAVLFFFCGSLPAAETNTDNATSQDILATIPEAKDYQLVYDLDIGKVAKTVAYDVNNSAQITTPFDRIAYLLELTKGGQSQWVYVSMDAFTDDAGKVGVPTFESKAVFQQYVTNLNVLSNVKEITTGSGLKGNIEFWPNNYSAGNALNIPNASSKAYDFGDTMAVNGNYGSMQVHNFEAKQTLFAFNCWVRGGGAGCDLGIGNSPGDKATDWTFAKNGASYESKRLRVLVRMAPGFKFTPTPKASSTPAATPMPVATSAPTPAAAPAAANAPAAPASHDNRAIIPVKHQGGRTDSVITRAKAAPGNYDIEFIGDSLTQGWEGGGKNVWQEFYGKRKVINMGVSGDRTEHVLWRFEQGQLDGIKAKVAIVMIGTNNSNNKDFSDNDILEGVVAIVNQIRTRQPDTKILLLGIFPRGNTFSPQRGRLLEINQVLAKLEDGKNIFYLDFGSQYVLNDGSIDKATMPDALHPNEAGYKIWANAMEPKLKQLLGE